MTFSEIFLPTSEEILPKPTDPQDPSVQKQTEYYFNTKGPSKDLTGLAFNVVMSVMMVMIMMVMVSDGHAMVMVILMVMW
ncbi:hypothetical protein CEXT_548351 [Caerostris extrusa]|uniref:Uncharacterized protein n=1 Tax=Caerostris extrusa TaxID=172846 RepID=A0AAV4WMU5_CAEEX|nr:hypothetical protein CEXT_548351 [Caerostris extrusa]